MRMPINLLYQPGFTAFLVWFGIYLLGELMNNPTDMVFIHIMGISGGAAGFFLYGLPVSVSHAISYGATYALMYIILIALFGNIGE